MSLDAAKNGKIVSRFGKISVYGLGSPDGRPCLPDYREQKPLGNVNLKILAMDDKSPVLVQEMTIQPTQPSETDKLRRQAMDHAKAEFEAKVAQALADRGNGSVSLESLQSAKPELPKTAAYKRPQPDEPSPLGYTVSPPSYVHTGRPRNPSEVPPPPQLKTAKSPSPRTREVPEVLRAPDLLGPPPRIAVRFQVPKFGLHTVDYDLVEFSECKRFLLLGASSHRTSVLPVPSDEEILIYPDNLGKWLVCYDTGIRFNYGGKQIGIFSYEEAAEEVVE